MGVPIQAWKALNFRSAFSIVIELGWNLLLWCLWQGWTSCSLLGDEEILQVHFTCLLYNTKTWMMKNLIVMGCRKQCCGLHPIPPCSWTKGILQGKSWKQLIFRNRLEFNSNDHNMLPGGPPPWPDLTANFFHKKQPAIPSRMKVTGWGWICSTDPACASIKRIRQINNNPLTQKNIEY